MFPKPMSWPSSLSRGGMKLSVLESYMLLFLVSFSANDSAAVSLGMNHASGKAICIAPGARYFVL